VPAIDLDHRAYVAGLAGTLDFGLETGTTATSGD
jgi:hypothetical protein